MGRKFIFMVSIISGLLFLLSITSELQAQVDWCSIAQGDAQQTVTAGGPYKNHGQEMKTATQAANPYLYDGKITEECHSCIVNQFARGIPIVAQEPCGSVDDYCSSNAECDLDEYCEKTIGDCGGQGSCQIMPTACMPIIDPVCGCNGETYGNECDAAANGVTVAYLGECVPGSCTNIDDCDPGYYCYKTTGDCDGVGTCQQRPDPCGSYGDDGPPVCGCNGQTYPSACLAALNGISVNYQGQCCPCFLSGVSEGGIDYNAQDLFVNPYTDMCINSSDIVKLSGCRELTCPGEAYEWTASVRNVGGGGCTNPPCCGLYDIAERNIHYESLGVEQAQACIDILLNSNMWERNCSGD